MAVTHQNTTVVVPLIYPNVMITTARTVDKGVINIQQNSLGRGYRSKQYHSYSTMENEQRSGIKW